MPHIFNILFFRIKSWSWKVNLFLLLFLGAECGVNADVEKHLELGKKLLAAGQLADALSQFHAAVGLYLGTKTLRGHSSEF